MTRRVVITGIGAVTPLGVGARNLFERWSAGESGIEEGLARCVDFDPSELLTRKEQRRTDRFAQLLVFAGEEALNHAGWSDGPPLEPERVATVIGTGIGGIPTIEQQHDRLREAGPRRISPLSIPLMMANARPAELAMCYRLECP